MGFNWKKFLGVVSGVGIPALETFLPASRPVVGIISQAVAHHGEDFNIELFLGTALPLVQDRAKFTQDQLAVVAALIQSAVTQATAPKS